MDSAFRSMYSRLTALWVTSIYSEDLAGHGQTRSHSLTQSCSN